MPNTLLTTQPYRLHLEALIQEIQGELSNSGLIKLFCELLFSIYTHCVVLTEEVPAFSEHSLMKQATSFISQPQSHNWVYVSLPVHHQEREYLSLS